MKIYSTLLLHNYHDYTCASTPNLHYIESLKQNTAQDAWTNQESELNFSGPWYYLDCMKSTNSTQRVYDRSFQSLRGYRINKVYLK